ncbi:MAG: hypothetical protein KC619_30650 [Myxococcales bacterium]|nr:hypothetical protein [Myxococcales bacterium]
MSPRAFSLLVFALAVLGIGLVVVRWPLSVETMYCHSWFALPRETGPTHLRGCLIDLRDARREVEDGHVMAATVTVRASRTGRGVRWTTRDPEILRRVAPMPDVAADPTVFARWVERHQAELVFERDVEARLRVAGGLSAVDLPDRSGPRALSTALLPFALGGLLLLVLAQRRWRRAADDRPLRF